MGDPITAAPMALSLASTGLSGAGKVLSAQGTATADQFKAEQLDQAATYGELKATQVAGQLTRNLNISLGNIDAVRAANKIDPTSPTASVVRDFVETTGSEQRDITVDNIMQQARTDEASAQYLRKASSDALLSGDLSAVGGLLKGGAGALKSTGTA